MDNCIICKQRDTFISFFPICTLLISFSCFIALSKTISVMLNRNGWSRHSYLAPDLRGKASGFSPLSVMLAIDFLWMFFLKLGKYPSIPSLCKAFTFSVYFFLPLSLSFPSGCSWGSLQFFSIFFSLFFQLNNFCWSSFKFTDFLLPLEICCCVSLVIFHFSFYNFQFQNFHFVL